MTSTRPKQLLKVCVASCALFAPHDFTGTDTLSEFKHRHQACVEGGIRGSVQQACRYTIEKLSLTEVVAFDSSVCVLVGFKRTRACGARFRRLKRFRIGQPQRRPQDCGDRFKKTTLCRYYPGCGRGKDGVARQRVVGRVARSHLVAHARLSILSSKSSCPGVRSSGLGASTPVLHTRGMVEGWAVHKAQDTTGRVAYGRGAEGS